MSELDKIYLLAYLLGPTIVTWNLSMKITLEKSILMYFLSEFWRFRIFSFVKEGDFITDPSS